MNELLAVVIGAAAGGIVTFFSTRWQIRKELEFAYDKDLRERRIATYTRLWQLLEPLAKYSRPIPQLTTLHLQEMSELLRHWYFADGGFFLSIQAREAYFTMQETLTTLTSGLAGNRNEARVISPSEFDQLRKIGSDLRSSLVKDVGSRRTPEFAEMPEGPSPR
jgi:hypothetical protein